MRRCFIVMILVLAVIRPAMAATATANFNVTITVLKQCSVTPPATMSFGAVNSIDAFSQTLTNTQNFSITCSKGTAYTITFASPNDVIAGGAVHQMKGTGSNTQAVQYNFYDATTGNPAPLDATTNVISDTGSGSAQNKSLKAQILNYAAAASPDVYTDTVTMTVTY